MLSGCCWLATASFQKEPHLNPFVKEDFADAQQIINNFVDHCGFINHCHHLTRPQLSTYPFQKELHLNPFVKSDLGYALEIIN